MWVMLRQIRCSALGTKLKISSLAINRRTNRSASLKSCLRPRGARLENACAKCKRMWGSSSIHTDRQYCAVDSITASSTPCSRNHVKRRCNSLGTVTNRRRAGFSSGLASTTTTINTFLCTSSPQPSSLPPGVEAAERTRKRLHPVTCYHLCYGQEWPPHRLVQNARSRSNSKTASLHPECKQTFAVHAPSAYTHNSTPFSSQWVGPQAHA